MGFLDQLKPVWPLVMQAPWVFAALAVAMLLAGWAVGRFMYGERIATLKERVDAYKEKLGPGSPEEVKARISELEKKLEAFTSDPRLLKPDQLDKMATALKRHKPGAVIVSRGGSSLECGGVQKQVRLFFKQQGWSVRHWETMDSHATDLGLTLFTHTGDEVTDAETAVRSALDAGGIPYNLERQVSSDDGQPQLVFNDID